MPVVCRCRRCGGVLYVHPYVGFNSYGVPTPSEVMLMYGGRCPVCGAWLTQPSVDDVVVLPPPWRDRVEALAREEEARRRVHTVHVLRLAVARHPSVGVAEA